METKYTYINVYCHRNSDNELSMEEIKNNSLNILTRIIDINNKQFKNIFDIPENRIQATVGEMFNESILNPLKVYDSFYISVSCGNEERWI